jgi:hypothetical protein
LREAAGCVAAASSPPGVGPAGLSEGHRATMKASSRDPSCRRMRRRSSGPSQPSPTPCTVSTPRDEAPSSTPPDLKILGHVDKDEPLGCTSHETFHYLRPDGSAFPATECPLLLPRLTGETVHVDLDWFVRKDTRAEWCLEMIQTALGYYTRPRPAAGADGERTPAAEPAPAESRPRRIPTSRSPRPINRSRSRPISQRARTLPMRGTTRPAHAPSAAPFSGTEPRARAAFVLPVGATHSRLA